MTNARLSHKIPPKMIFQLIYISRAASEDSAALDAILASSRRNNVKQGLTGVLLHSQGVYLQLLEGDEESVREVFGKIERDPRHAQVTSVIEQEQESRLFDEWTMDVQEVEKFHPSIVQALSRLDELMPEEGPVDNAAIMDLLLRFSGD